MIGKETLNKTTEIAYKNLNCISWHQKNTNPGKIKRALFLHVAEEKAIQVYNAMIFIDTEKGKYKAPMRKFQEYIQGKKDIAHKQYRFNPQHYGNEKLSCRF